MPEVELTKDPLGANRGKTLGEQAGIIAQRARKYYHDRYYIPPYRPTNKHWEITFSVLGWKRHTIEKFWKIFCHINKSLDGAIKLEEFLDYFDLDWTPWTERCFAYFDTTGGGDIDFLEFIISVWNVCTFRIEALSNFAFDMYDLDSDGELSIPEIEKMVLEFFGGNGSNKCLECATRYAEERGGALNLNAFISFTARHQYLLFPMFQLQRTLQKKICGLRYWAVVERTRKVNYDNTKNQNEFNPRHVQILLRTYQTGGAAAVLSHTGDPNKGLRDWYENQKENDENHGGESEEGENKKTALQRWNMIRDNVHSKAKTAKQWSSVKTGVLDGTIVKQATMDKIKHFKAKARQAKVNNNINKVAAASALGALKAKGQQKVASNASSAQKSCSVNNTAQKDAEDDSDTRDEAKSVQSTGTNKLQINDQHEKLKSVKANDIQRRATRRMAKVPRNRNASTRVRSRGKFNIPNNVRQRHAGTIFYKNSEPSGESSNSGWLS